MASNLNEPLGRITFVRLTPTTSLGKISSVPLFAPLAANLAKQNLQLGAIKTYTYKYIRAHIRNERDVIKRGRKVRPRETLHLITLDNGN